MKILLALTFSFYSVALFSQETSGIEYSLAGVFNWDMFRGKINQRHIAEMGPNTGAVTVSSLSYKTIHIQGKTIKIKISAEFNPLESWTRYPKLEHPEEALNHEKRHFDICEIYARKIRQVVSQAHLNTWNFNGELDFLFKKLVKEYHAEQARYDRETNHSMDAAQQKKWNTAIDAQLKTLSDYSSPIVTVTLN